MANHLFDAAAQLLLPATSVPCGQRRLDHVLTPALPLSITPLTPERMLSAAATPLGVPPVYVDSYELSGNNRKIAIISQSF